MLAALSEPCNSAAIWGGAWGKESGADRNIDATKESKDYCDVSGLYEPVHQEVVAALTRG